MKITINNLSIHMYPATPKEAAWPAAAAQPTILAAFLHALHDEPADTDAGTTAAPGTEQERYAAPTAPDVQTPTVNPYDVGACEASIDVFLQPTERFQCRTLKAINKAMTSEGFTEQTVATALHTLVEDDVVTTRRRRADGETLYSLA